MSSVVEAGPDPSGRRATWWSATVQWRNWPLLVKLGMVLVVPVVSALVLGVLRVQADIRLSESYAGIERVAALRAQFVSVVSAVERERNEAVRAGGQLQPAAEATDKAVAAMTAVVARNPDLGEATSGYPALIRSLETLPATRRSVTESGDAMVVLSAYNAVVNTVLEYDRSLVGQFPDENLAGTSIALSELLGMREQVALEQAIGSLALRDRALPVVATQLLIEADVRLDDKLDDFRSQAPPALAARYEEAMRGADVTAYQLLVEALRTTDPARLPFGQELWETRSNANVTMMTDLTRQAATDLRADSAELAESVSNRAGLESVLLLTMVLLAAGVGGVLGRYLLRSVGLLRRTALDVANERLPAAVASFRAGEGAKVTIEPVPLRTTEEFGQLARAFDAVHDQAVRSAAEEASLRGSLANIFTNLSRRSQGLVERQLRLMEQLEQKTEDPDQLANLFKIDHLATRMRRNNENLMVLSGTALLRRFTEPMPLPDVLRAAISEVEHYQRAVVRSVPEVRVAGYAAGDLIRSVSELIENATAFSPPDSQVTVTSRELADGAAVIDIIDDGVGMSETDLRDANQRIAGGGGVDVPISRQMGLFVVGRLTARHGIQVRLLPRAEGGLCAAVLVPAGLITTPTPAPATEVIVPPTADWLEPATAAPSAERPWPVAAERSWPPDVPAPAAPTERFHPVEASAATGEVGWLDAATPTGSTDRPTPADAPATSAGRIASTAAAWAEGAASADTARARGADAFGAAPVDEPSAERDTGADEPDAEVADGAGAHRLEPAAEGPADGIGKPWPVEELAASATTEGPAPWMAGTAVGAGRDIETADDVPSQPKPYVPAEVFEPVEVSGRLQSAGIIVQLPDLPSATTPASILFAADGPVAGGGAGGFSWLNTPGGASATTTMQAAPVATSPAPVMGPGGLPKRVPKGQLRNPSPPRGQQPQAPASGRDAARARGFLSGFQAGIRRSENRRGETGP